jgi:hypothetical protein
MKSALQPRARARLHDLKKSHYNRVCNLASEIVTHLSCTRNDERAKCLMDQATTKIWSAYTLNKKVTTSPSWMM